MPWQPPHAEIHFTLFFLQHVLDVQSPEQLQEINRIKLAEAMLSKVIKGSNCPSFVTCHPYNLGSLDILFKSIQSCTCRYALRECYIAELVVCGRLAGCIACCICINVVCIMMLQACYIWTENQYSSIADTFTGSRITVKLLNDLF